MFYATFDGFHNEDGEGKIRWTNVRDEVGNYMKGFFLSEKKPLFKKYKARRGNRYLIFTSRIVCREFIDIYRIKKVNKNPKCDIFRKANNKYYIVRGKYKGKIGKVVDLSVEDDQVDVKMPDGKERYLGFDDVELADNWR